MATSQDQPSPVSPALATAQDYKKLKQELVETKGRLEKSRHDAVRLSREIKGYNKRHEEDQEHIRQLQQRLGEMEGCNAKTAAAEKERNEEVLKHQQEVLLRQDMEKKLQDALNRVSEITNLRQA
eukprot:gene5875-6116_t